MEGKAPQAPQTGILEQRGDAERFIRALRASLLLRRATPVSSAISDYSPRSVNDIQSSFYGFPVRRDMLLSRNSIKFMEMCAEHCKTFLHR